MIDKERILKKNIKKETKSIVVQIRITPTLSKWLADQKISPTGLFYEAVREVGYKEVD